MIQIAAQPLVQDSFLQEQREMQTPVSIYLKNGIRLQGTITDFDMSVVLLESYTSQMIYKRAIATIVPTSHECVMKQPGRTSNKTFLTNR